MKTSAKIISLVISAVMLLSLVACGKKEEAKTTTVAENEVKTEFTTVKEQTKDIGEGTAGTINIDIMCDVDVSSDVRANPDVLSGVTFHFNEGETVYDALKAVTAANDIAVVDSDGYVTGIDGLSTGDAGDYSGWLFMQNSVIPEVGANACTLADGDLVQWIYTADYNEYFK